jgi:DNA processing protein
LPPWWSPATRGGDTLLGLAATPGALPSVTAARLAAGADPVRLLRADSPDPRLVTARLEELGARFILPGDPGWPFAEAQPDPPCAWLFITGPLPPAPATSVAIVGGRKASALRRATASSLAAGLAASGICVVSGGAIGVDAAAHAGALDGGGHTVVVLGCGLDVPYPRRNVELFRRIREAGGTLLAEHPPGAKPLAANFVPRNRLIAALSGAVVVVEAALGSGSLATARAAGSRGHGQVLAVPGAPWDRGAEGCNDLIRDGATLVRSLDDVLEALTPASSPPTSRHRVPASAQCDTAAGCSAVGGSCATACGSDAAAGAQSHVAGPDGVTHTRRNEAGPGAAGGGVDAHFRSGRGAVPMVPRQPWPPGASRAAWRVLEALTDQRPVGLARLSEVSALDAAQVASALLELELAGLVRRTSAGVEAIAMPFLPDTRGPPPARGRSGRGAPSGPGDP